MNHSRFALGLILLFLATPVRAQDEVGLYFPNVVSLWAREAVFENIFMLLNPGEREVRTTLRIYTNEGVLDSEHVFDLAGGELASLSYFVAPFQFFLPQVQGWAALTFPAGNGVRAYHRLSAKDHRAIAPLPQAFTSATTEAIRPGTVFRVILADVRVLDLHSISIVNPSLDEIAEVGIELHRHDTIGYVRNCAPSMSIAPMHRVSRFIEQDICEKDTSGAGWPPGQMEMIFSSNLPIAFSVMEFFPDTGGFAAIPVDRLDE